jgi:hypothetical protein
MTLFEVVYGRLPHRLLTYVPGTTQVAVIDEVLKFREEILGILQHNLQHAQQRMKKYTDLKRSEMTLAIGQQVSQVATLQTRFLGYSKGFEVII